MSERALLDRKRSFASVFGEAAYVYEQDGKRFDHSGLEVIPDVPAPEKGRPPEETPSDAGGEATPADLRKRYFDLTGRKFPVGTTKADMVAAVAAAETEAGTA